jgi:2-(1,2-epoxy-1,2-dihydrophenyl)acetyl-CoA isomerase
LRLFFLLLLHFGTTSISVKQSISQFACLFRCGHYFYPKQTTAIVSTVQFEVQEHLAIIRLNRPDKLNSINREMALALHTHLDACAENKNIRAVLITGEGRAFCAGQDLEEAIDTDGPGLQRIVSEHYNPLIMRIRRLEKPVIAAVNGVAAGAGANIALCCDIVVAAQNASFIQAFSAIGLIPDSGGTFTLPRLVGRQKASALMMLGDKISAEEAERMGMIYKWYSSENFAVESLQLGHRLSQMPTRGLALTKKALEVSDANDLETQLQVEDELQTRAGQTFDYSEGVAAFLEKRKPQFKGE